MTLTSIPRQPKDSVLVRTNSGTNISLSLTKNVTAESPFDKSEYKQGGSPYTHVTPNNRHVKYSLPSGKTIIEMGIRREGVDDLEKYEISHHQAVAENQPCAIASLDDDVCRGKKIRLGIYDSSTTHQDGKHTKTISIDGDSHIKMHYDNSGNKQCTEVLKNDGTWEQYITKRAASAYPNTDKKQRTI